MDRSEVIETLRTMPERLRAALTVVEGGAGAVDGEAWSAREVVAHIRATDAIQAPQIFVIAVNDTPHFPGVDERELAERAGYLDDPPEVARTTFATRRAELVRLLERLAPEDWQRPAVHQTWGRVTLEFYARHVVEHEAEHLAQLLALRRRG